MQKAHDAQYNNYWQNLPSVETPIVAAQLNRNEQSVDAIDDRVIVLDTTKANETDMLQAIKTIVFDSSTGTFTITFFNNTTQTIDTDIEKIAVNFDYDDNPQSPTYQKLIITLDDGTVKYVDLSSLISEYEFEASQTIQPTISGGKVTMDVIDGSITGSKLQPNYLADVTLQAEHAADSAEESESWAVGGTGSRIGEDTDNAKYYAETAGDYVSQLLQAFGINVNNNMLIFGAQFLQQFDIAVVGTTLVISNPTP